MSTFQPSILLSCFLHHHKIDSQILVKKFFAKPGSRILFVYPDMRTAVIGHFKANVLIEGRETKIVQERCHKNIKEIRVYCANRLNFSIRL